MFAFISTLLFSDLHLLTGAIILTLVFVIHFLTWCCSVLRQNWNLEDEETCLALSKPNPPLYRTVTRSSVQRSWGCRSSDDGDEMIERSQQWPDGGRHGVNDPPWHVLLLAKYTQVWLHIQLRLLFPFLNVIFFPPLNLYSYFCL